ncbi:MAG: ABC transporter ATP-binding protein [Acetanaerobacterium sp.]
MPDTLVVENLSKSYGKKEAVKNVSFTVGRGEIFALIGPNGAGKTSTIRVIATLLTPTAGDALVDGVSVVKDPAAVRRAITYLPDEAGAYKNMTGARYLDFMASLFASSRADKDQMVARASEICALGDRLPDKIATYSRGMIRKLLLSRAVMSSPKLAVLDEPTSGLDIINALEIRRMIKELAAGGMSFLVSSHNMLEIEFISGRVGIIHNGVLLECGRPEDLKQKYGAQNLEEVFERAVTNA